MINQSSALWIGMALGIGFGIGEIWYLAWQFSFVPPIHQVPILLLHRLYRRKTDYSFSSRGNDINCDCRLFEAEKGLAIGYIGAILLHALTNIGALLYQMQVIDGNATSILLLISVLVSFVIFEFLRRKTLKNETPENNTKTLN